MAISFGTAYRVVVGSGTSATVATTVSGSTPYGVACVLIGSASDLVSSVTWNGVGMTRLDTRAGAAAGSTLYVYGLANVATGNLVANTSSSTQIQVHAGFYPGAGGGLDATAVANGSGTGTSQTVSFTPTADNCWMILYASCRDTPGNGIQAGTGATKRGSNSDDNNLFDNNAAITPPASTNMQVTQTLPEAFAWIVFAISPGSVGPTNWKTYDTNTVSTNLKTLNTNPLANIKTYNTIS